MKIGLYFGSFNPIHNGHLLIASYFADNFDFSQVWLVVSPQNPLKKENLLNEYARLYLTRISVTGDKRFKVSDVEFHLPKPSFTIDTLTYLEEKYPAYSFTILLGSDSYQNLKKWKNYNLLIKKYSFLVYNRIGFTEDKNLNANTKFANVPLLNISSTQIRNLIKNNKSIRYYVPECVKDEIEKSQYYK